ncbi:MAG: flagellar hook-associated protein FlgL [Deltaproteobacteria bacterium]|nr:flagellar hook-associated protein FlgL [Deltaproteobacteria bacterium]MBW2659594.1 flagellar hook-associated protein FlgL [Deltaproteobacteria bacterium]
MKVTENSAYRLMQSNLNRITGELLDLRNQGATGLKLNRPSDDPGAVRPVFTTRTQLQQNERYIDTMGHAGDRMASADGFLEEVENILSRVKEISINAVNGAMSPADLGNMADEIAGLKERLTASANAVVGGKYIFAGFNEKTRPFTANPAYDPALYDENDLTTWPYLYNGDHNRTQLEITPDEYMDINLTGNELFMGISNEIAATGSTDPHLSPTSVDLFSVLTRTEEAVRSGNVDDTTGPGGSIQAQLTNLDIAADQNRTLRGSLGIKAKRIDSATLHLQDARIDLEQILSRYQDADMIEVFNDIVKYETSFRAALNISGRISNISILDYF